MIEAAERADAEDRPLTTAERIIGGGAMLLGPLLWLTGLALRKVAVSTAGFTPEQQRRYADEPFAAPEQLAAYAANPGLVTAGYAVFLIGAVVMIPAVAMLARLAATRSRVLAPLGGLLLVCGLIARMYAAGVEQAAFSLVDAHGLEFATAFVMDSYVDISYGPWRVPVAASAGQYVGALLLAVALHRARVFGTGRAVILVWWATMWSGVLKSAGWGDLPSDVALALVLAPFAVHLIRTGAPRLLPVRRLRSW